MKTIDFIMGVGLIILGLLFLADNLDYIDIEFALHWPVLIILGGAAFAGGYLQNKKNYGFLMPGTILLVYGLLFWYCSLEGWYHMQFLWPLFLIGPGLGFLAMYYGGVRDKGLLIPAAILVGLGLLFLLRYTCILRYWSVILIIIGIYLIYKHQRGKNKSLQNSDINRY